MIADGPVSFLDTNILVYAFDSLIVVAAARAGASILYTEDLNDGQEILGVRVRNPFQSLPV